MSIGLLSALVFIVVTGGVVVEDVGNLLALQIAAELVLDELHRRGSL